jgi:hypothetical protein
MILTFPRIVSHDARKSVYLWAGSGLGGAVRFQASFLHLTVNVASVITSLPPMVFDGLKTRIHSVSVFVVVIVQYGLTLWVLEPLDHKKGRLSDRYDV